MTPGRDQFICRSCGEPADEDEAPSHCPFCGWDGFGYATDNSLPQEVTLDV
jgi:rubrerythrin